MKKTVTLAALTPAFVPPTILAIIGVASLWLSRPAPAARPPRTVATICREAAALLGDGLVDEATFVLERLPQTPPAETLRWGELRVARATLLNMGLQAKVAARAGDPWETQRRMELATRLLGLFPETAPEPSLTRAWNRRSLARYRRLAAEATLSHAREKSQSTDRS